MAAIPPLAAAVSNAGALGMVTELTSRLLTEAGMEQP